MVPAKLNNSIQSNQYGIASIIAIKRQFWINIMLYLCFSHLLTCAADKKTTHLQIKPRNNEDGVMTTDTQDVYRLFTGLTATIQ